jgi:predicted urease superfamily metal-dependent hydrolase
MRIVPRVVADRIMMQDDFVRLHEFLLETDTIADISDDLREVVEKEWPELAHKLPPKRGPPPS